MNLLKTVVMVVFSAGMTLQAQYVNPDQPVKGEWDLKQNKLWEIFEAGEFPLGRIQEIRQSRDGRVYLIDSKVFKIHIFSKEGNYISSFGKKGEGPGEIRDLRMGAQLFIPGDKLIISERGRIHYFSLEGKYLKSVPLPRFISPRLFIHDDLLVSAPLIVENTQGTGAVIKTYDLKTKEEKMISTFDLFKKASSIRDDERGRMVVGIVIPGVTPMMMLDYHKGALVFGKSDKYDIVKSDLNGKILERFALQGRKTADVPGSLLERIKGRLKDIPDEMVKTILSSLPKKASFFQDVFIGDNGYIFIVRSIPHESSSRTMDIFSPEGKYLYRTKFTIPDENRITYFSMQGKHVFLAFEDEEGDPGLAVYSAALPK